MGLRLANVLWKPDGAGVLVMAGGNVYRLNGKGARVWRAIDRGDRMPDDRATAAFIHELIYIDLVVDE